MRRRGFHAIGLGAATAAAALASASCFFTGLDELRLACAPHCGEADASSMDGSGDAQPLQTVNCAPSPHLCGFPDQTNTGVRAGVALKDSGPLTITTDDSVVEGLSVAGGVIVKANRVTLRNLHVDCTSLLYGIDVEEGRGGVKIEDTEINAVPGTAPADSCLHAVNGGSVALARVHVHDVREGLFLERDSTVEDSYVHSIIGTEGAQRGVLGALSRGLVRHNTIDLGKDADSPCVASAGASELTIESNLLTGGGYVIELGTGPARHVIGNRFSRRFKPKGGDLGLIDTGDVSVDWQNNVWDDDGSLATP